MIGDIHGEEGYHLGDEAMLISTIEYMAEILPDYSPIVLSWYPDDVKSLYRCNTTFRYASSNKYKWFNVHLYFLLNAVYFRFTRRWLNIQFFPSLESIKEMIESSFILHTGSGSWNTAGKSGWWLFDILVYLWCAFLLDIPVLIVSQSLGPFSGKSIDKKIVSWLAKQTLQLSNIRLVTVRDRIWSTELLSQLRSPNKNVGDAFDDAIWMPFAEDRLTEHFCKIYDIKPHSRFIVVSLSDVLSDASLKRFAMAFSKFLESHSEYKLVFIPHVWPTRDLDIHSKVSSYIDSQEQVILVESFVDARLLKSLTARATVVISSRYHGIVIAASVGVPGIAIVSNDDYYRKMTGVIDMCKSPNISLLDAGGSEKEILIALERSISLLKVNDLWFIHKELIHGLHNKDLIKRTLENFHIIGS